MSVRLAIARFSLLAVLVAASALFFPPAAPIIYSAFLLMVLLFLLVRGTRGPSPRRSMYSVLSDFGEVLDGNLDEQERAHLLDELNNGGASSDPHVAQLAAQLAGLPVTTLVHAAPHPAR